MIHHNCSFFKKVINFLVTAADHADGEVAAEEEESMPEGTEEGDLQAGRHVGPTRGLSKPPRQKKANIRLTGPAWAK
jgi:hypothetical protein